MCWMTSLDSCVILNTSPAAGCWITQTLPPALYKTLLARSLPCYPPLNHKQLHVPCCTRYRDHRCHSIPLTSFCNFRSRWSSSNLIYFSQTTPLRAMQTMTRTRYQWCWCPAKSSCVQAQLGASLNLSHFQQKIKAKSSWVHLFLASTSKSILRHRAA